MSKKQIGIVPLTGTIGNITFYEKDGEYRARKKTSLSRQRIMNNPRFQSFRENISEIRSQAMATSSVLAALSKTLQVRDSKFHLRLRSILNRVNKGSPGTDGERGVVITQQKQKLARLEMNSASSFKDACNVVVQSTPTASRNSSTVSFSLDMEDMKVPKNATHFRLVHELGIVSDVVFNAVDRKYEHVSPEVDRVSAHTYSETMAIDATETVEVSLTTTLPLEAIPDTASVVEGLAIQFYKTGAEGKLKRLIDGAAGFVVNVF